MDPRKILFFFCFYVFPLDFPLNSPFFSVLYICCDWPPSLTSTPTLFCHAVFLRTPIFYHLRILYLYVIRFDQISHHPLPSKPSSISTTTFPSQLHAFFFSANELHLVLQVCAGVCASYSVYISQCWGVYLACYFPGVLGER